MVSLILIHWIGIYPRDSAIHLLNNWGLLNMWEQVRSLTRKKSSDFHGGIRFQSRFTIRWELEDKTFLKIDIICLDDSLKYRIMAIKTNENFIPFSNSVTFRKPRVLRTIKRPIAGIVPGIKSPPLARTPPPPHGIYIDRCISHLSL